MEIKRFQVYLVSLDPTQGSEIQKTRPCVVISPNEMNVLNTVIVAPMTTKGIDFCTRIPLVFQNKKGHIALDQIRAIDKVRLIRMVGHIDENVAHHTLGVLTEMFAT